MVAIGVAYHRSCSTHRTISLPFGIVVAMCFDSLLKGAPGMQRINRAAPFANNRRCSAAYRSHVEFVTLARPKQGPESDKWRQCHRNVPLAYNRLNTRSNSTRAVGPPFR